MEKLLYSICVRIEEVRTGTNTRFGNIGKIIFGDKSLRSLHGFVQRESILKLKEKLMQSEIDIQKERTYSVEETVSAVHKTVVEISNA